MTIKGVKKFLMIAGFAALVFAVRTQNASAASLYLSPSSGNYYRNENFTVSVFADSDVSVNAISGTFVFPSDSVEVLSLNKSGSIINLWVKDPSFSNEHGFGNVNFGGIVLNPGFTGTKGKILSVVFKAKSQASAARLNFSEFSILANDGLGTGVGGSVGEANFTFTEAPVLPKAEIPKAEEQLNRIKEIVGGIKSEVARPETWRTAVPAWIWAIVEILLGLIALIIAAIVASFGVIILIWIWNYILRREGSPNEWPKLVREKVKKFFKRTFKFLKSAEKEIEGDLAYGADKFKEEIKEAESGVSFGTILRDFWVSLVKIIKRFFIVNGKK